MEKYGHSIHIKLVLAQFIKMLEDNHNDQLNKLYTKKIVNYLRALKEQPQQEPEDDSYLYF
jgi:hypothetical protein